MAGGEAQATYVPDRLRLLLVWILGDRNAAANLPKAVTAVHNVCDDPGMGGSGYWRASGGDETGEQTGTEPAGQPGEQRDAPAGEVDETGSTGATGKRQWLNIDNESDEQLMSFLGYDRTDRLPADEDAWTPPGRRSSDQPSGEATDQAGELEDLDSSGAHPDSMPLDDDGEPAVDSDGYKSWYESHGADDRDAPAPWDREIAERMPDYTKKLGTAGVLTDQTGSPVWDQPQFSGYDGPTRDIELPLHRNGAWLKSHVEMHAAAEMVRSDLTEATLYVNRPPCPLDSPPDSPQRRSQVNCDGQLEQALPPDAKLTVHGPGSFWKVYLGRRSGEGDDHG